MLLAIRVNQCRFISTNIAQAHTHTQHHIPSTKTNRQFAALHVFRLCRLSWLAPRFSLAEYRCCCWQLFYMKDKNHSRSNHSACCEWHTEYTDAVTNNTEKTRNKTNEIASESYKCKRNITTLTHSSI